MERFRSRGDQLYGSTVVSDYGPSGDFQYETTRVTTAPVTGAVESVLDNSIPGFKKLRAKGQVFMNPVTQISDSRFTVPSNWSFGPHPSWGKRRITGDVAAELATANPMQLPDWNEKMLIARDEAIVMAWAKVADSDAMALVSVAEARKTALMLKDPFQRSYKLVGDMVGTRLRRVKQGMKWVDATVSAYLEFRFGFQPLVFDLLNVATAYTKTRPNGPVRLVARGSRQFSSEKSDTVVTSFPGTTSVLLGRSSSLEAKVAAGILYELTESSDESRARAYGLRLTDVPSALYELVPFSFIVDRYVRAGQWLNAIVPKPGVNVLGKWVTETVRRNDDFAVANALISIDSYPPTAYNTAGGSFSKETQTKTRSNVMQFPTLPPLNTREHSLVQIIDEIALTASILKTFDVKQLHRWETYAPKQRWISLYRRHPTI